VPETVSLDTRILQRWFDDREVRAALDGLTIEQVCHLLASNDHDHGQPSRYRTFAEGQGYWKPGDGRAALASDDPAVIQALGRCAAYQARLKFGTHVPLVIRSHPRECAWCDYPLAELLRACDWATVASRFLVTERLTWHQRPEADKPSERGSAYHRAGLGATYLNTTWAAFWKLDAAEREALTVAAQYPETAR